MIDRSFILKEDDRKDIDPNFLRDYKISELKEKNKDTWGWLYIPDTSIDRYVMKEPVFNVYKYLWRDIDHKLNRSGSYFIPGDSLDEDGNKKHSDVIEIMGHHLSSIYDRSPMFTGLLKMYKDKESALEHRYAYTYDEKTVTKWEVWTSLTVNKNDIIYQIPYIKGCPCYKDVIEHIEGLLKYQISGTPSYKTDQLLVLSTCKQARPDSNERFIVLFVPVETYDQETKTHIDLRESVFNN